MWKTVWQKETRGFIILMFRIFRGRSSVGRALESHSRGREFESHRLHDFKTLQVKYLRRFIFALFSQIRINRTFVNQIKLKIAPERPILQGLQTSPFLAFFARGPILMVKNRQKWHFLGSQMDHGNDDP